MSLATQEQLTDLGLEVYIEHYLGVEVTPVVATYVVIGSLLFVLFTLFLCCCRGGGASKKSTAAGNKKRKSNSNNNSARNQSATGPSPPSPTVPDTWADDDDDVVVVGEVEAEVVAGGDDGVLKYQDLSENTNTKIERFGAEEFPVTYADWDGVGEKSAATLVEAGCVHPINLLGHYLCHTKNEATFTAWLQGLRSAAGGRVNNPRVVAYQLKEYCRHNGFDTPE